MVAHDALCTDKPTSAALSTLLSAVRDELKRLELLCTEAEVATASLARAALEANSDQLQSLDTITQNLRGLAMLFDALVSCSAPDLQVDVDHVTARVVPRDLVERLLPIDGSLNDDVSGDIELF